MIMKMWFVKKLLKYIDRVLGVKQEKPVYIILCGEGCLEFQICGENTQKMRL